MMEILARTKKTKGSREGVVLLVKRRVWWAALDSKEDVTTGDISIGSDCCLLAESWEDLCPEWQRDIKKYRKTGIPV